MTSEKCPRLVLSIPLPFCSPDVLSIPSPSFHCSSPTFKSFVSSLGNIVLLSLLMSLTLTSCYLCLSATSHLLAKVSLLKYKIKGVVPWVSPSDGSPSPAGWSPDTLASIYFSSLVRHSLTCSCLSSHLLLFCFLMAVLPLPPACLNTCSSFKIQPENHIPDEISWPRIGYPL